MVAGGNRISFLPVLFICIILFNEVKTLSMLSSVLFLIRRIYVFVIFYDKIEMIIFNVKLEEV